MVILLHMTDVPLGSPSSGIFAMDLCFHSMVVHLSFSQLIGAFAYHWIAVITTS